MKLLICLQYENKGLSFWSVKKKHTFSFLLQHQQLWISKLCSTTVDELIQVCTTQNQHDKSSNESNLRIPPPAHHHIHEWCKMQDNLRINQYKTYMYKYTKSMTCNLWKILCNLWKILCNQQLYLLLCDEKLQKVSIYRDPRLYIWGSWKIRTPCAWNMGTLCK